MDQIARDYWNLRYETGISSGNGSYGEQLEKKLKWLSGLSNINSVAEVGCGDFNFGSHLMERYPSASYSGTDISDVIVQRNKREFPKFKFENNDSVPEGDLLLCIDVLLHIIDDNEYERVLTELEKHWTKYLAVTAYEYDQPRNQHIRVRKFDYKRFGEPIIREVVEEDGQLYFYLFKKPEFDLTQVSCCLITKDATYPKAVLDEVSKFPFGEIAILTHCDSPHRKQELFAKAKYDWIYYQDDDCIAPIKELAAQVGPGITCAMKPHHIESYKNSRIALVGWGSFFPKKTILVLDKYRAVYGEDFLYKRETERIMTYLNYPQKRLDLPIIDLPSATAPDRLSMQPGHYDYIPMVEERCKVL